MFIVNTQSKMSSNLLFLLPTIVLYINIVDGMMRIDPLVHTEVGLIRGVSSKDGTYSLFMGIPFAKVNESNPFGAATPFPNFEDTFDAVDDSAICPQVYQFNSTVLGSIDCLHLNIYVPFAASSKNRLPVMVWIYGGSFARGFSGRFMFDPGFIVRHNVILVTFNYRVGPYGFMCLDVPEVPGNQGLKDQFLAFQWINDHIESFGGDVNQITLFGESAGGHSVDLHLLSQKETLYSKVILQSGSAQAGTVLIKPDKATPFKLAAYLGFTTTDVYEALAFLSRSDTNLVIAASDKLGMLFKPCIETKFLETDSFVTESWVVGKVPKVATMPILIGFNRDELIGNHQNRNAEHFEGLNIFSTYLTQTFNFEVVNFNIMHEVVRHFYLGDEPITEDMKEEIVQFDSDFTYIHPILRTLNSYIDNNAGNIYYYMFAYEGERNFFKKFLNITNKGTGHADELGYLFDMQWLSDKPSKEDQLIIDRMTTLWTNFAKYSDPTPETSELLPIKWSPVSKSSLNYLRIDKELTMGNRPLNDRMAFWDLFYKLNEKFQIDFK